MENNPLFNLIDLLARFLGFDRDRFERFVCWARHLHYADLHLRRYRAWKENNDQSEDRGWESMWELIALEAAYYASSYVVIEGWHQVPLSDPVVDELLAANPRYVKDLKRYRHSVFHYQPTHVDIHKRQVAIRAEGPVAAEWLAVLHLEFCRVYWQSVPRAARHPASEPSNARYAQREAELASELRECMLALVGWIPTDIPAARMEKLREMSNVAMARMREAGDFESDEALELLKLVRQTPGWITEEEFRLESLKLKIIEEVRASAANDMSSSDTKDSAPARIPPGNSKVH